MTEDHITNRLSKEILKDHEVLANPVTENHRVELLDWNAAATIRPGSQSVDCADGQPGIRRAKGKLHNPEDAVQPDSA